MEKCLEIRKDEPLYKWCQRICDYMDVPKDSEWREILSEVSKESYIKGSRDCQDVLRMHGRL